MTEKTEIINKTAGYSFHVKVERETRTVTGAKYPDKTIAYVNLSGNDEGFETMLKHATEAKAKIEELLAEKKQEETSEVAVESEKGPGE